MGKFLVILATAFLCLVTTSANATSWLRANEVTIAWDAVSSNPGDQIAYKVFLKNTVTSDEFFIAEESSTEYLITFVTEGLFLAGVSTVRKVDVNLDGVWNDDDVDPDGNLVIVESTITWSNSTDIVEVPDPFGLSYFAVPTNPIGLNVK